MDRKGLCIQVLPGAAPRRRCASWLAVHCDAEDGCQREFVLGQGVIIYIVAALLMVAPFETEGHPWITGPVTSAQHVAYASRRTSAAGKT